jgi:hypothetical protein
VVWCQLIGLAGLALAGCSISTIKEGMTDLKGQPISAAIAKLGLPDEEATVAGVKKYTWRPGTIAGGDQYQCRIRVIMAGDVIGSFEGSGDFGKGNSAKLYQVTVIKPVRPFAQSDGHDLPRLIDELVQACSSDRLDSGRIKRWSVVPLNVSVRSASGRWLREDCELCP